MPGRRWTLLVILFFMFVVELNFMYGFADVKEYKPAGIALVFSIVFPLILYPVLYVERILQRWRILMNPWVREVKEMDNLFNPMFFAWLYFHDKKRYVKWTIGFSLPFVFILGALIVGFLIFRWVTAENFMIGFIIGAVFTVLLSITYYQSCWK